MPHPVELTIGYRFRNPQLLQRAMTHSSWANEKGLGHSGCNERLEFLGDSVLGFVTADFLYESFPNLPEGMLTKFRAELVCEQALSEVAAELCLGDALLLSKGEERSGGRTRPSMTADSVEALIAALYLDGGFETAAGFIHRYILTPKRTAGIGHDCKSELQELVQREKDHILSYRLMGEEGPDHDKRFRVAVYLDETLIGEGTGTSKKRAEQAAAGNALEQLKKKP